MLDQAEVSALKQYEVLLWDKTPYPLKGQIPQPQSNAPGYIFMETSVKMPPFNVQFSW